MASPTFEISAMMGLYCTAEINELIHYNFNLHMQGFEWVNIKLRIDINAMASFDLYVNIVNLKGRCCCVPIVTIPTTWRLC
jgi:hypothetical protein